LAEHGRPEYLNVEQQAAVSALRKEPQPWTYENGIMGLAVDLPTHGVAGVTIEFAWLYGREKRTMKRVLPVLNPQGNDAQMLDALGRETFEYFRTESNLGTA
jgi:hypothetical protein